MGKIVLKQAMKTIKVKGEEKDVWLLDNEKFGEFNAGLLGLGDISSRSTQVEALAAVFDLSGFTNFCGQVDPHLSVPEYLSGFLEWLFGEIKKEFVEESYKEGKKLWADLPFLAKFLGDGVLFLWDTEDMSDGEIRNTVVSLDNIRGKYVANFYPHIRKAVVDPPKILRCGIARGKVFSVGNGEDYVGPCINIASRLEKLHGLTFCFSRRGIDMSKTPLEAVRELFIEKCVTIRGIGENELVWVRKAEFDNLPDEEKKLFREP